MKKILFLILALAFFLRLYRIDSPLADWHSWRQADTSAVSRNFLKFNFDLLHPRFDDLSNIASGQANPQGYRFVEFPFYNLVQAGLAKTLPFISLEVWGRLVSIGCSLISLIFLYLIVSQYLNRKTGLLAALFFAVLPYNIYYSRVILPEPMMVAAALAMIYFYGQGSLLLGATSAAIAFLLKPYSLVFLLPIFVSSWQQYRFKISRWLILIVSLALAILPFVWWRWWMSHYPEGIPAYGWLFNEGGIRFKGAWFYWLFAERVGRLILGYWGLVIFGLGLAIKSDKKEGLFFYSWLVAILAYFAIIAGGNVQHDYYQIIAVPVVCVFLAKGAYFLLTSPKELFNRAFSYSLLTISFLFMLSFSWYQVRDFFNINNSSIIEAGKAVDKLLPNDAKVIAPYGGDTAFLYQTNRQGWPVGISIDKMIEQGAQYYVNTNFGPETDWLEGTYCVFKKNSTYVIIDLTKKC